MTLLVAKALLAPLCVAAVSLAGRRWGIGVAGLLGGLPVVAGPILLAETLIHGRELGAAAGAVADPGRRLLRRRPATAAGGLRPRRRCRAARLGPRRPGARRARPGADAHAVSGALGPHLSGLLAPFPIITSILAFFTQAHGGTAQLEVLLRNFLLGFYGFASFCFVLAVALPDLATAAAFGLATAAALAVQATLFLSPVPNRIRL